MTSPSAPVPPPPPPSAPGGWASATVPGPGVGPRSSPRRIELDVRNLVLGLGVTCLVAAAVSLVAVNWESFDAAMRAGLLVGATVATLLGSVVLRDRGYGGTGSALSWLTTVLVFVDLFAVERATDPYRSADGFAALGGLVLFGVFVALDAWRPDAAAKTGAVAAWLLASMSALAYWDVTGTDLWVLPTAAVIAWVQWRSASRRGRTGSWHRYGVALAVAATPAVLTALDDPHLIRPVIVIAAATLLVVAGVRFRHLAAVWVGGASLGVLVSAYLFDALRGVPGWAVFALVGVVLLGVGACIEHRLRRVGATADDGGTPGAAPVAPAWR